MVEQYGKARMNYMNNNEKIIQKYSTLLSQKIYDCFYIETQLDVMIKNNDFLIKEIERLKKLLDDNKISYEEKEEEDEFNRE